MVHLIDKDDAVAEIKKRIKETESMQPKFDQFWAGQISAFKGVLKILDSLEVKEVDLEEIVKSHFNVKNINDVKITTTGENLLNLARRINEFVMNTAFEQYSQIGESTGNESLNEEIEKTIKMNDMWCGLMPNTLIKYTAKHFFELGLKAQKDNIRHSMDEPPKYPCDILLVTDVDNIFLCRYMENGRPVDRETPYFRGIENGKCWYYCNDIMNIH